MSERSVVTIALIEDNHVVRAGLVELLNRVLDLRAVFAEAHADFASTPGLRMCRRLLQAMNSELQVQTRPGMGTRFDFEADLPRCERRSGTSFYTAYKLR